MAVIYSREGQDIGSFLDEVHDQIMFVWKLEERAMVERKNAEELAMYLRALKLRADGVNVSNMVGEELDRQFGELALEIFSLQKQAGSGVRSASQLFRRQHGTKTAVSGADDIFEEELYLTLKAIESKAAKKSVTIPVGASLAGRSSMNIKDYISADEEVVYVMSQYQKNIAKSIEGKTDVSNAPYNRPVARAGKTDVKGLNSEVNVSADIKPEWQRFFELLQGATFSLKNYAGGKWVDHKWISEIRDIGLGNSDIYKAYAGVLSTLGASNETINHSFVDAYYASFLNQYDTSKISLRLYQIRFAYELVGAGLIDASTGEAEYVKYLIWNDPGSNTITVASTAELMLEQFKRDDNAGPDNPFGTVRLSQSALLNR